jgi:hypothetical protein
MISLWTLSRDSSCLQDLVREAINSFQEKYDGKVWFIKASKMADT